MKENQAYLHAYDDKVEALLAKMTLKEKIGQLYDERGRYLCERGKFDVFVGDDCMTKNRVRIVLC